MGRGVGWLAVIRGSSLFFFWLALMSEIEASRWDSSGASYLWGSQTRKHIYIPGSSKGCWMDGKGCLYTIPSGSNNTLWKMRVHLPKPSQTTPPQKKHPEWMRVSVPFKILPFCCWSKICEVPKVWCARLGELCGKHAASLASLSKWQSSDGFFGRAQKMSKESGTFERFWMWGGDFSNKQEAWIIAESLSYQFINFILFQIQLLHPQSLT